MYNIPEFIKTIIFELNTCGYDGYVVGGACRDLIMGRTPKDWDICTDATPTEIKEIFNSYKVIPTGEQYGTITVGIDNEFCEITTYRYDSEYTDGRRPDTVYFGTSIIDDLKRRDFTINAIAYYENEITDPFNGMKDIKDKVIRCVGNPDERFKEDALRIMRAVRFSVKYGFEIEKETYESMLNNMELLKNVSQERIHNELIETLKYLNCENKAFEELVKFLFPALIDCNRTEQFNPYHRFNVFEHTMRSLAYMEDCSVELKMAMLLHDIGKPYTIVKNKFYTYFPNHEYTSHSLGGVYLNWYKFSNKEIDKILFFIVQHTRHVQSKIDIKMFLNEISKKFSNEKEMFSDFLKFRKYDLISQNHENVIDKIMKMDNVEKLFNIIVQTNEPYKLSMLDIDGNDIKELGIEDKEIGKVLNDCLQYVIGFPLKNNKKDLLMFVNNEQNYKKRLAK